MNAVDKNSEEGILATLQAILKNHGKDVKVIRESNFVDDLGLDSLGSVELVMDLESEYDIEVNDEELQKMKTAGDLVDYVIKALAEK